MSDKTFAEGIFFDTPHENAPDFVLGKITINQKRFLDWLVGQEPNEKGYVKLNIKRSRSDKIYLELDTWKADKAPTQAPATSGDDFDSGIPF